MEEDSEKTTTNPTNPEQSTNAIPAPTTETARNSEISTESPKIQPQNDSIQADSDTPDQQTQQTETTAQDEEKVSHCRVVRSPQEDSENDHQATTILV
ncbi:hypothetical protein T439DRAFT_28973 [Meredithblackwellia eburnea MCA 4105]